MESGSMAEFKIDYEAKTITKKLVHNPKTKFARYNFVMSQYTIIYFLIVMVVIVYYYMIRLEPYGPFETSAMIKLFWYSLMVSSIVSIAMSALLTLQHFIFPKRADIFFAKQATLFRFKRKVQLTKMPTNDFVFMLPNFNNMYLRYNLEGDFGRHIKSLSVVKLHDNMRLTKLGDAWGVHFVFKKIPTFGRLRMWYY